VRGRRIDNEVEEQEESEMFRMGEIANLEGLCAASVVPKSFLDPPSTNRDIRINEVLGEGIEELNDVFEWDVGDSSKDEDSSPRSKSFLD